MRRLYSILAVLAILAGLTIPAYSQILYGSILGTVEDPTGSVVPKAKVTITNKATGAVREAEADEAGRYSLLNVVAGPYEMKISAAGFRTLVRSEVEVAINQVTRVDARLEVGQMTEQVTVSATAVALQTDKSDVKPFITQLKDSAVITLRRLDEDRCSRPVRGGVQMEWTFQELGLPPGANVLVNNPYMMDGEAVAVSQ